MVLDPDGDPDCPQIVIGCSSACFLPAFNIPSKYASRFLSYTANKTNESLPAVFSERRRSPSGSCASSTSSSVPPLNATEKEAELPPAGGQHLQQEAVSHGTRAGWAGLVNGFRVAPQEEDEGQSCDHPKVFIGRVSLKPEESNQYKYCKY